MTVHSLHYLIVVFLSIFFQTTFIMKTLSSREAESYWNLNFFLLRLIPINQEKEEGQILRLELFLSYFTVMFFLAFWSKLITLS